ncbi:4Fe-4S dicluster domain-containing protein [Phosphitispora sp. TUW77]|uniref:4Fe-4S dicluster domain-containing protein n=1 Tax=Phosphitispora sp. TUW77 TaxID=3152361 RepID=UPI003AB8FDC2
MAELAMYIDVTRCTGCRGCQVACKQWNELPAAKTVFSGSYENPPRIGGDTWTKVRFFEKEDAGKVRFLFRKEQCMHCSEPSCAAVCAAGAIKKTDNGMVLFNDDRCVGCKNCVVACPFHVIGFSKETGSSRKCRLCYERIENDMEPACVKACPTGAVSFGDRRQMLAQAKQRVSVLYNKGVNAQVYGENELGGLHVIYVLDDEPEVYGLPANPEVATAGLFSNWLHALLGVGVVALAPFWLIFRERGKATDNSAGTGVDGNA